MSTDLSHLLSIRAADASDAPAVLGLFAQLLAALGTQPNAELDSDMADFPAGYAENGRFIVADHALDGLVGMAGLRRGEIRRLFVAEAWRGRHLARRLITDLLRTGPWPNGGPLTAIIGRENHASRRVFAACGFVSTGRVPAHPLMRHCLVYECWLSPTVNPRPPTRLGS